MTADERFWAKVVKTDKCWIWTAATTGTRSGKPYGVFVPDARRSTPRTSVLAHRYAYERLVGPIPAGLTLDHVADRGCTSTLCVNPAHLEPVTVAENIRRWNAKRTHCKRHHPLSGANLYIHPTNGGRVCRTCQRERYRRFEGA